MEIPATNAALLALNNAWSLSDAQKWQLAHTTGIYPIDRAEDRRSGTETCSAPG